MQAFIFDFDGVIVDSERYWDALLEANLKTLVPGITKETIRNMMGQSAQGVVELLNQEYGLGLTLEGYLERIDGIVMEVYLTKCELMPGFRDLVRRLQDRGIPLAIASSSQRRWVEAAMTRFELHPLFPVVVTGDDAPGRAKPLPDLYLLAASRMKADHTQCVAIEDSRNGIAAAQAAGMKCIALKTELNEGQDLSAADLTVTHMDRIDVDTL